MYKVITDKVKEMEQREHEHEKFTQRKSRHYESSPSTKKKQPLKPLQEPALHGKYSMKPKKTIKFKRQSNQSTPSQRSRLGTPKNFKAPSKTMAAERNAELVEQLLKQDGVVMTDGFDSDALGAE